MQILSKYTESERVSHSVMSDSLQPHGLQHTRLLCPWNSPGKNIGVGCHSLLPQGIFPTQGLNPGLLHCRQILYLSEHQGNPEEYWIGLSFPSAGILPNPGIESATPALAGEFFTTEPPGKPIMAKKNENVE